MQKKQVTEVTVDADQAIALTSVEEKDLAISEYKKKYEEILKLKKGMTHEIEALRSSLKTKEAGMHYTTYSQKFPSPFAVANPKKNIFVHKI